MYDFYIGFIKSGFQVLRINYAGSTTNYANFKAGLSEIGYRSQEDICDVIKDLSEKNIINSSNLSGFGFGYGGYLIMLSLSKNSNFNGFSSVATVSSHINMDNFLNNLEENLLKNEYLKNMHLVANSLYSTKTKHGHLINAESELKNSFLCKIFCLYGKSDIIIQYDKHGELIKDSADTMVAVEGMGYGCYPWRMLHGKQLIDFIKNSKE